MIKKIFIQLLWLWACYFSVSTGINEKIFKLSSLQQTVTDQLAQIKIRIEKLKQRDKDLDSEIESQENKKTELNSLWEKQKEQDKLAEEEIVKTEENIKILEEDIVRLKSVIQQKTKELDYLKSTEDDLNKQLKQLLTNAELILQQEQDQQQALLQPTDVAMPRAPSAIHQEGESTVTIRKLSDQPAANTDSAIFMDSLDPDYPVNEQNMNRPPVLGSTVSFPPGGDPSNETRDQSDSAIELGDNLSGIPKSFINLENTDDSTEADLSEAEFTSDEKAILQSPPSVSSKFRRNRRSPDELVNSLMKKLEEYQPQQPDSSTSNVLIKRSPRVEVSDPITTLPAYKVYNSPRILFNYDSPLGSEAGIYTKKKPRMGSSRRRSRRSKFGKHPDEHADEMSVVDMSDNDGSDAPKSFYELGETPGNIARRQSFSGPNQAAGLLSKPKTYSEEEQDSDTSFTEASPSLKETLGKIDDVLSRRKDPWIPKKDNPFIKPVFTDFAKDVTIEDARIDLDESDIFDETEKKEILEEIRQKIRAARDEALSNPSSSTKNFNTEISNIKKNVIREWKKRKNDSTTINVIPRQIKQEEITPPSPPDMNDLAPFARYLTAPPSGAHPPSKFSQLKIEPLEPLKKRIHELSKPLSLIKKEFEDEAGLTELKLKKTVFQQLSPSITTTKQVVVPPLNLTTLQTTEQQKGPLSQRGRLIYESLPKTPDSGGGRVYELKSTTPAQKPPKESFTISRKEQPFNAIKNSFGPIPRRDPAMPPSQLFRVQSNDSIEDIPINDEGSDLPASKTTKAPLRGKNPGAWEAIESQYEE